MARGGGKSVIIGDPRTDKTPELLRAFGRFVHSLNGRYHTGEDVGMSVVDLDIVRQETPFAHGHAAGTGDPSLATAYGVFTGIRAAAKHKFGYPDLSGRRIAVQGLGNVGFNLCQRLAPPPARVYSWLIWIRNASNAPSTDWVRRRSPPIRSTRPMSTYSPLVRWARS